MPFVNVDAIDKSTIGIGEAVTITHYTGDTTYDEDQNPSRTSEETETFAEIKRPNKFDVNAVGSDITIDDKKFALPADISIVNGDIVKIDSLGAEHKGFEVKTVREDRKSGIVTRILAFASNVE